MNQRIIVTATHRFCFICVIYIHTHTSGLGTHSVQNGSQPKYNVVMDTMKNRKTKKKVKKKMFVLVSLFWYSDHRNKNKLLSRSRKYVKTVL